MELVGPPSEVVAVPQEKAPPAMDWGKVEASLLQLESVEGARIVPDPAGGIAEVHILAKSSRSPKMIARDVQSFLITRWGIRVDHRKVSVARFEDEAVVASEVPRLALQSVRLTVTAELAAVEVELAGRETLFVGRAKGPLTPDHVLRLAAEATLEALKNDLARVHLRAILRSIRIHPVAGRRAILVLVNLVSPYGELLVVGSAYIRRNELWSTSQAVLDAVNRRLTMDTMAV